MANMMIMIIRIFNVIRHQAGDDHGDHSEHNDNHNDHDRHGDRDNQTKSKQAAAVDS